MVFPIALLELSLLGVVVGHVHIIEGRRQLADSSGGIGILGVIIGAVIVAALGYFLLSGTFTGGTKSVDVNIKPPAAASK